MYPCPRCGTSREHLEGACPQCQWRPLAPRAAGDPQVGDPRPPFYKTVQFSVGDFILLIFAAAIVFPLLPMVDHWHWLILVAWTYGIVVGSLGHVLAYWLRWGRAGALLTNMFAMLLGASALGLFTWNAQVLLLLIVLPVAMCLAQPAALLAVPVFLVLIGQHPFRPNLATSIVTSYGFALAYTVGGIVLLIEAFKRMP